jgi:hypothetical protein
VKEKQSKTKKWVEMVGVEIAGWEADIGRMLLTRNLSSSQISQKRLTSDRTSQFSAIYGEGLQRVGGGGFRT